MKNELYQITKTLEERPDILKLLNLVKRDDYLIDYTLNLVNLLKQKKDVIHLRR